jgi:exodeoxyribonuclease VII small subunit
METTSFESACARLEEILEALNGGKISLDAAMVLYEEADRLIKDSVQKLNAAEKKIETLLKGRDGELLCDVTGAPLKEDFSQ